MASPTPNKGYTYPAHGGSVNAWDTPLNADFDQIDLNVAGFYLITASSTTAAVTFGTSVATVPSSATAITPNTSIAQNLTYRVAGAITSTMTLTFPTVGGMYIIDNQTSSGTLKVNTTTGTSAATIATGGSNLVYTSTYASNSANVVGQFPAKLYTQLGTPAGSVPGTAGTANGSLTDTVWDATNRQLYVCLTTGTSATAIWAPFVDRAVPQGYLTLSTDANNPILTADAANKTAVYYTPFVGNWTLVSNGTVTYPYQFTQQSLALTAGVHGANNIYDVFIYQSTTASSVIIGTGPAWTTATAGAGARGSGAGTSQLSKLNGLWTNTVQVTLTNGATTFTCPIGQGVYLGSILMDGTAGQVTCHRSYGQNRKWGVWNTYNRQKVILKAGETSTAGWTYASTPVRVANASTGNSLQIFSGLAEEALAARYLQQATISGNGLSARSINFGIGWNSTNTNSGTEGTMRISNFSTSTTSVGDTCIAQYITAPSLGMQQVYTTEYCTVGGTFNMVGAELGMTLSAEWNG